MLWVSGESVALIPAVNLCLIIHRLRKASLLTAEQGWKNEETGALCLEWAFLALY